MGRLDETPSSPTQIYGTLNDGLTALDLDQEITFQEYTRVVLPIDGYIFWTPTVQHCVKGSLHYSQELQQNEDETLGYATVVFSSKEPVQQFAKSPVDSLFVARHRDFRFAFSQQQGRYKQAGLWHYFGHSVIPALASQLLDQPGAIDPAQAVTSNSLALWLALNSYAAPYWDGFANGVNLYPSFCVPPNLAPPYGAIHIPDDGTRALQGVPLIDRNRNHFQLCADRVRVTLYGLQNNAAIDFLDCVLQYSRDTDNFGLMNTPCISDAKRTQAELQTIAMKKTIDFEVSYYQTRVASIARQLILKALLNVQVGLFVGAP